MAVIVLLLLWAVLARAFAPKGNTTEEHVDAIIVLGSPGNPDGTPRPMQLAHVTEGVHEYERGVAPRLILTGAAVANESVEAESMARVARAQGVPPAAVIVEPEARDTIQNACYAVRIMKQNGWHSAEVISSGFHLKRAGLIFSHVPIEWRTHAAPPLGPDSAADLTYLRAMEVLKTARYLVYAQWAESCTP